VRFNKCRNGVAVSDIVALFSRSSLHYQVQCLSDAVAYVKSILDSIHSSIGQSNVETMLSDAERMLREIESHDFTSQTTSAHTELNEAVEGLSKSIVLIVLMVLISTTSTN